MTTTFVTLKKGSQGTAVTTLQQRLKTLGYYSAGIDGDFGSLTEAAVIAFQKNNAVAVDGVVGSGTESAIERSIWVSQRPLLKQGSRGEEVKRLQYLLVDAEGKPARTGETMSFDIGAIDGDFGPKTKAAVIKFQNDRNLVADAVVGAKTWEQLSHVVTFDADANNFVRQYFFFNLEYVA